MHVPAFCGCEQTGLLAKLRRDWQKKYDFVCFLAYALFAYSSNRNYNECWIHRQLSVRRFSQGREMMCAHRLAKESQTV